MSFSKSSYIYPKWTFSGGVVTNQINTHLDDSFTPYARNFRLEGASVISRPGHRLLCTVDWTDYPRGIASYLRADPANDRLIVRQNVDATHKLVSITEAWVATNILTNSDITSDNRMITTNIGDNLYIMNGTDFGKLAGTTYTNILTASHLTTAPAFSCFFGWCHWVSWLSGANSNKVYKSPNNAYEDFTASGSDIFTFPENVTWMVSTAQAIFVFTKNTVQVCDISSQVQTAWVITFQFRPLQTTEGSTNHASIVAVGSDVYYISPSNSINKIVRGASVYWFEVISLSQRKYKGINNIADLLEPNQTDCHAQSFPSQNLIKWFFKSKGSSICDYCLVFDIIKDMFIIDTNKFFYDEIYFHWLVYSVSNITPTVYIDEYGQSDNGGQIDFEYWTKAFDEGEYTLKKCYWESRTDVDISELAELTQEIYINSQVNNQGNVIGTLIDTKTITASSLASSVWGIGSLPIWTFPIGSEWAGWQTMYPATILRTKGNLNTKWYSIQYRYTNSVIGSQVRLKRVGYKVEVLSWMATNLTS